jgi:hypothetical protein
VYLIGIFPGVVAFRISFPLNEVLQGSKISLVSVGMYMIHFVFLFSFDQV